ncbi:MAG: large protein [Cytophagaceae bacterium]|nr:large protein [Cytophagaceae bacterium]
MFLLFAAMILNQAAAQIQVDSMKSSISTCLNNGSISIYAQSSNPPILYSITAGPVTQGVQTGNVFNSLPSGTFTILIADGLGSTVTRTTTVAGNYQLPDFNPAKTDPLCPGNSNGRIKGNLIAGSGRAPFQWQLIAPSTVTTAPQSSDQFDNLPAGNYTVRVTDNCGSYRTNVVTLTDPGPSNLRFSGLPSVSIGCPTSNVTFYMLADLLRVPYTFTFETTNGTITTNSPEQFSSSPSGNSTFITVQHSLPNFSYGDYLKVTVTDNCGNTVATPVSYARPFNFCPSYIAKFSECIYLTRANLNINNSGCTSSNTMNTYMNPPVTYECIDVATGTTLQTGTVNTSTGGVSFMPLPGNKTYNFIIKDACGNTFSRNLAITNPTAPQPVYTKGINKDGCVDSVATLDISTEFFKSVPSLIFLSGPSTFGSTKPDYSYTSSYAYPDTFAYTSWGGGANTRYNFEIKNLGPGTYKFKLIDSCGTERFDSVVIRKTNVISLGHEFSYKKGCLGKNEIHYTIYSTRMGNITVSPTGTTKYYSNIPGNRIRDSILNVPSGTYQVTYTYSTIGGTNANATPLSCASVSESIVIKGYETPTVSTGNSVMCGNFVNIELFPDSSKGVPPYQYEIISGPQLFPVQNSNIFNATLPGTYTVRIYDVCGNASTKSISIDTLSSLFNPANVIRGCADVQFNFPASLYYTYKWEKPNNTTVTTPSLSVNPITPADTGTYYLTRISSIAGCKDTVFASYHVSMSSIYSRQQTICSGQTITLGAHTYSTTGTYHDTLTSQAGCDSIMEVKLTVTDFKRHSISMVICQGDSVTVGLHTYSVPGIYYDTLSTGTCDSIVTFNLSMRPVPSVQLGNDTSFCQGKSITLNAGAGYAAYYWNGNPLDSVHQTLEVNTVGRYTVTVKNQHGCIASDTMEVLTIHPLPVASAQDAQSCAGKTVTLSASGGNTYEWLPGGETTPSIQVTPSATTTYQLIAYDLHHCASNVQRVTVYVFPVSSDPVFERSSLQHCFDDDSYTLSAAWGNSFLWIPTGETTQAITVEQAGIYSVTVSDVNGCKVIATITIENNCPASIYVPSGFSPNGDGLHDDLEIFGRNFTDFSIMIFNRWGEIIFVSNDRNNRWDGKYRGEEMPIGTYPWIIHYKNVYDVSKKEHTMNGSITLVR